MYSLSLQTSTQTSALLACFSCFWQVRAFMPRHGMPCTGKPASARASVSGAELGFTSRESQGREGRVTQVSQCELLSQRQGRAQGECLLQLLRRGSDPQRSRGGWSCRLSSLQASAEVAKVRILECSMVSAVASNQEK